MTRPRDLVLGVGLVAGVAERRRQEREPERRERDADPLAAGHLVREEPVGGDREQHQAAGDRRLDQRDRRQRERADVEAPAAIAMTIPSVYQRVPKRANEVATAGRMSTRGDATAPRCL